MHQLPHSYVVSAAAEPESNVTLASDGLESVISAPPEAFGGPGDLWSPETLLVAAVADCLILSFRAIARASSYTWSELQCSIAETRQFIADDVTVGVLHINGEGGNGVRPTAKGQTVLWWHATVIANGAVTPDRIVTDTGALGISCTAGAGANCHRQ